MENTGNTKRKTFKNVLLALLFIALAWGAVRMATYFLIDRSGAAPAKVLTDFYEQDSVEVLFLGASHMKCGIDTNALTEQTGKNCFTLSTNSQASIASYYLLKEAVEKYPEIESVCYEISFPYYSVNVPRSTIATYLVSDNMRSFKNKLGLLYNSLVDSDRFCAFVPLARSGYGDTYPYVKERFATLKKTIDYKRAMPLWCVARYKGRGYISEGTDVGSGANKAFNAPLPDYGYDTALIDMEKIEYLDKMVEYCRERGITFTVISLPILEDNLAYSPEAYDGLIQYFTGHLSALGVMYFNFNTVSRIDMPLGYDCYIDKEHLNDNGSAIVTPVVAEMISTGTVSEKVYGSVVERLNVEGCPNDIFHDKLLNKAGNMVYDIMPTGNTETVNLNAYLIDSKGERVEDFEWSREIETRTHTEISIPIRYQGYSLYFDFVDDAGNVYSTSKVKIK